MPQGQTDPAGRQSRRPRRYEQRARRRQSARRGDR
jgi:hypothetical protein